MYFQKKRARLYEWSFSDKELHGEALWWEDYTKKSIMK